MKRILKHALFVLCVVCIAMAFSSCTTTTEDLYQLPKMSEQNSQLWSLIEEILDQGASYSPPSSGTHRQSVQLEDLDGDGQRDAISFFQVAGDTKPLKVHIFRFADGEYQPAAVIEGEGETIDSISYADMNNDGAMELIIGWQISTDIKLMNIYTLNDFQPYVIVSSDYTDYSLCSINNSGRNVFLIRLSPSDQSGEAVLYSLLPDGELDKVTAPLSSGVVSVSRIKSSPLLNGVRAVFVEETTSEGFLTDIFTLQRGVFTNITLNTGDAASSVTYRTIAAYSMDINGDGVLDIPVPVQLNSAPDSTTTYYAIRWYSYSSLGRLSKTEQNRTVTTFHNSTDGWFLVLSDDIVNRLYVRRDASRGARSVVFSLPDSAGVVRDVLAISTLTGDNREDESISGNRFLLSTKGDVIYTGEILSEEFTNRSFTKDQVSMDFHLIYSEWGTSEK
ncbi:MAG: VCBS repeat-containing protein [Oscillospiraceae bacterium]|nr:VCBS repeat-containing protein [Oscillospiraceae bacterium]